MLIHCYAAIYNGWKSSSCANITSTDEATIVHKQEIDSQSSTKNSGAHERYVSLSMDVKPVNSVINICQNRVSAKCSKFIN